MTTGCLTSLSLSVAVPRSVSSSLRTFTFHPDIVFEKGQEAALTIMLERTLNKRRILEIYLNVIEWGDGFMALKPRRSITFASPLQH